VAWFVCDAGGVTQSLDVDIVTSDTDSSSDEESDVISGCAAAATCYTKDAFHKYIIAGKFLL